MREVVKVACKITEGNPDGFYLKYKDEMLPGEVLFEEVKRPVEHSEQTKRKKDKPVTG